MNGTGKKFPIERGLAAKIFLLSYNDPMSGYGIARRIYNHDHYRIRVVINELSGTSFIVNEWSKDPKERSKECFLIPVENLKGHKPRWIANPNAILAKIEGEVILNDDYVLCQILQSTAFKFLVKNNLPKDLQNSDLNAIDYILSLMDLIFIVSHEVDFFKKKSRGITTKKDYDKVLREIKKDKELSNEIRKLVLPLFNMENKPGVEIPDNVFVEFPCLFVVPERLAYYFRGQSEFGRKYYQMRPIAEGISKLLIEVEQSKLLSTKK